jgi:hydrogenase maturation protease
LVFGWGNLSRGDDALGPLFIAGLHRALGCAVEGLIEFQEDYQLQIEHALDLVDRQHILLVDASVSCAAPFEARTLLPVRDASYTSHALSPDALLQVYLDFQGAPPPPTTLLAIRGESFELGASMGEAAQRNLQLALEWALAWIEGRQGERVNRATARPSSSMSTNCASPSN